MPLPIEDPEEELDRKNASRKTVNIAISIGAGILIYGNGVGFALLLELEFWSLSTQRPAVAITALYTPALYYLLDGS